MTIVVLTSNETGAQSLIDINANFALLATSDSPALTGNPTAPTQSTGDNDTSIATTAFVQAAIALLVNSSPAALDTLKELADALGDDPNYATTITTLLALKAPLASPTFSGTVALADAATISIIAPTVDGTATGPVTSAFNSGYSSSAIGDLVYLDSSATWQKCDANTLALYNGLLGIALEVKASGVALKVALPGSIVYATGFPTFTIGSPVYMSETAGAVTLTAPTTTDAATRVVGWGVHADKLYFFPSPNYITHT